MSNRLAQETSPYLLQHKENPVDWYPWGPEALERSIEENKPILLSIGYSACHWCHVMEHESFENAQIAELMNKFFVCIKVDREERPDLDHIYQNVAQALTRGGGWPLTVFLTPARKPFYGGTYFPPDDRYGRPGFKRVLANLAKAYQTDPMGIAQNAMKLSAYIEGAEAVASPVVGAENAQSIAGDSAKSQSPQGPAWDAIARAAEGYLSTIDYENGGIGSAPKFPNPMTFSFLWRFGTLKNHDAAKSAVLLTLRKMASGGIYDHLGGGFSRYSVDESWSVPHFEKMLYDNGLLLKLYSEVLLSGDPAISEEDRELFTTVVRETVQYLLREMVSSSGGFFAAQDADSEGEEGKFFVWDLPSIEAALSSSAGEAELAEEALEGAHKAWSPQKHAQIFALRYGVTEAGNFEHAKTVLYLAKPLAEIAAELTLSEDDIRESLDHTREILFRVRDARIHPGTDNKIITSWNGLIISGLAWASQAIRRAGFAEEADEAITAATRAFQLISEKVTSGQDGKLFSTFQGGVGKHNAYLDDYAFMAMACLDLSRFAPENALVVRTQQLATLWLKRVIRKFKDSGNAGYFFTSDDHEELIHRPKTIFDQAIPSGTAVVLQSLMVMSEIDPLAAEELGREARTQLSLYWELAQKHPHGCSELMSAGILQLVGPFVISGPGSEQICDSPFVFRKPPLKAQTEQLIACHNQTCAPPYKSAIELKEGMAGSLLRSLGF